MNYPNLDDISETRNTTEVSDSFAALICQKIAASRSNDLDDGNLELDSHADSPVLGRGAKIVRQTGRKVSVRGFSDELGHPINVEVVDGILKYECELTGNEYILVIRNALHLPSLKNHLIPPFMMRLASIEVNECPKFLAKQPSIEHHSLYFPNEKLRLPLLLCGIISYLPTVTPSNEDSEILPALELTPQTSSWNPHSTSFQDQEDAMMNYRGELKDDAQTTTLSMCHIVSEVITRATDPVLLADDLLRRRYSSIDSDLILTHDHVVSGVRYNREHFVSAVRAKGNKSDLTARRLAENFGISDLLASKTLNVVTRLCPRNTADISLSRRYATNDRMLRYPRMLTDLYMLSDLFMDTMLATPTGKSIRGFTRSQIFATHYGWVKPIHMYHESGSDIAKAVKIIFKRYGVPDTLICDAARAQIWGEVKRLCDQSGCEIVALERNTPNSNRAERAIGTLKQDTKRDLVEAGAPAVFWCYAMERRALINNSIARDDIHCHGQTRETVMTGQPTDISNLADFKFYEWVKFRRDGVSFPFSSYQLGRCLGPASNQGPRMAQYVMTDKGQVMPIQTLRRLTKSELNNPFEIESRKSFDEFIQRKYGDPYKPSDITDATEPTPEEIMIDFGIEEKSTIPHSDSYSNYENYVGSEVLLPQNGEHMHAARVIGLARDDLGNDIGTFNPNPIMDTRVYEVMFPDGAVERYAANILAENMLGQVDEDGYMYRMLDTIEDHRTDGTEATMQGSYTTRGHEIKCVWSDGTMTWVPLKDLKESYPIECAEFAISAQLTESPAFSWWVPFTLKKRDQIISKVQHRLVKKKFKYGFEVPNSIQEAYEIDKRNNNTRWRDAISKEMRNVRVAFKFLQESDSIPPAHEFVPCHLVFDVKMDGTAKARLVAAGCRTADPQGSTWAGVVSRETVRIALTYAALNNLKIMTSDIQNAYLTAPSSQKLWTTCGREFGGDYKKRAIVTRALYGNKSAGADFRNHLRECMDLMGYSSCLADPDLWIRKAVKDSGEDYYEYVLLYVDDALGIGERPKEQLQELDKYFKMKPGSITEPKLYLGAKLSLEQLPNGETAWSISSSKYIQDSIVNVNKIMEKKGLKLRNGIKSPITKGYRPELDGSPELGVTDAALYQSLIGTLRWIVEMGRIDIICEVSMLSSYVSMPREGHLQQLFHIFGYLKTYHNARIMMDPTHPVVMDDDFPNYDWKTFYKVEKEAIPTNAPVAYGNEMVILAFVDADHAGDLLTRRSRTGFIVFVNMAPVYWVSKKQSGVESSTFGSEFLAMKHTCEYLRGLRYKIRMMGIPIEHCCYIYGDNKSVLYNTTLPESTIKQKSHSIAYHFVREGCARGEWKTTYIKSNDNCADICTKSIPAGIDRKRKVRRILYDIYPLDNDDE